MVNFSISLNFDKQDRTQLLAKYKKIGSQCVLVGLLLSLIPFGWSVVFKCQYRYLGVELLQVRRQSLER